MSAALLPPLDKAVVMEREIVIHPEAIVRHSAGRLGRMGGNAGEPGSAKELKDMPRSDTNSDRPAHDFDRPWVLWDGD